MPVSSNVSHQNVKSVHSPITLKPCLRKHISASLSKSTANTNCKLRSRALSTCQTRQNIEPSAEQGTARLLNEKYTALVQRISEWPEPYPSEKRLEHMVVNSSRQRLRAAVTHRLENWSAPPPNERLSHRASAMFNGVTRFRPHALR